MTHSPVKQMLKEAGLKMSLARLKVIDALWEASGEQGRVPIRTLWYGLIGRDWYGPLTVYESKTLAPTGCRM
ncbi:TPA: hypothetical protein ACQRQZ_001563 [Pseudomonas aeruginosa]